MALPILDGNQSATTLSTILTGGQHIPAHTVVSLGTQAITDMRSAVSGSVVSISNFPATQTISGTVTANAGFSYTDNSLITKDSAQNVLLIGGVSYSATPTQSSVDLLRTDGTGILETGAYAKWLDTGAGGQSRTASQQYPLPIQVVSQGSVTIGSLPAISGTVTVSSLPASTVTVSSLPVISGTVTANVSNSVTITTQKFKNKIISLADGSSSWSPLQFGVYELFYNSSVTATLNNIFGSNPAWVTSYSDSITVVNDDGTNENYFSDGTQWVLGDFSTPAGNTIITGSEIVTNIANDASASLLNGFKIIQKNTPTVKGNRLYVSSIGTSTVTVGNSVTIGSLPTITPQLPRVTFIDGSGTVTTANTAVTVFASSSTRSYLLVQVTTGSAFVNVGATATTVNGISLTAGQGYAWETTIPQGIVSLISTTTSSRWVAKEA